jgi:hypothetical protein
LNRQTRYGQIPPCASRIGYVGFSDRAEIEVAIAQVDAGYAPLAWKASLGESRRYFVSGQFGPAIVAAGASLEIFLSEPGLAKVKIRMDRNSCLGVF